MNTNVVDAIVEVAKEVNESHIDWSDLAINEDHAYRLMAISALENKGLDDPMVARSVVTALLVENFVLNFKILAKK